MGGSGDRGVGRHGREDGPRHHRGEQDRGAGGAGDGVHEDWHEERRGHGVALGPLVRRNVRDRQPH